MSDPMDSSGLQKNWHETDMELARDGHASMLRQMARLLFQDER
jgi:hypothetical protein